MPPKTIFITFPLFHQSLRHRKKKIKPSLHIIMIILRWRRFLIRWCQLTLENMLVEVPVRFWTFLRSASTAYRIVPAYFKHCLRFVRNRHKLVIFFHYTCICMYLYYLYVPMCTCMYLYVQVTSKQTTRSSKTISSLYRKLSFEAGVVKSAVNLIKAAVATPRENTDSIATINSTSSHMISAAAAALGILVHLMSTVSNLEYRYSDEKSIGMLDTSHRFNERYILLNSEFNDGYFRGWILWERCQMQNSNGKEGLHGKEKVADKQILYGCPSNESTNFPWRDELKYESSWKTDDLEFSILT